MKTPITDLIMQEIKWCEAHRTNSSPTSYQGGFIAGLEQARALVHHAEVFTSESEQGEPDYVDL